MANEAKKMWEEEERRKKERRKEDLMGLGKAGRERGGTVSVRSVEVRPSSPSSSRLVIRSHLVTVTD